jgi:hypothetical protein
MNSGIPLKCSICPKSYIGADGTVKCSANEHLNKGCPLTENEMAMLIQMLKGLI